MSYILLCLASFLLGYGLCFKWFKEDIVKSKPIVFKSGVYVATKVKKIEL